MTSPLRRLGFLTIGPFDPDDPGRGHESTLEIIEFGERLGFDSAWLLHRHHQHGIPSAVAVLVAVTTVDWEDPLRLAENLATVDILFGG